MDRYVYICTFWDCCVGIGEVPLSRLECPHFAFPAVLCSLPLLCRLPSHWQIEFALYGRPLLCLRQQQSEVWSCYRRFEWLTMAVLNNATIPTHFPLSFHAMESIGADCQACVATFLAARPCQAPVNLMCFVMGWLGGSFGHRTSRRSMM